ncbi:MAG: protein translocase subunit SecF [Spirochaetes bacterium]|nr:protein translocase subunit SecF [Spirochaetota bacterium]
MSDRIIRFTRLRIPALILSLFVIIGGIAGTVYKGGFNFGIDFSSGLSMRIQIAESVLKVFYTGQDRAIINIRDNTLQITFIRDGGLIREDNFFVLADYPTVADLAYALSAIDEIIVEETGNARLPASTIMGLNFVTDLTESGVILNSANTNTDNFIDIGSIRETLAELGSVRIQTAGRALNQEFIIIMQNRDGADGFAAQATSQILGALGSAYGADNLVVKQSDYVGPQFSEALGNQVILLISLTLLLILVYIWFRFKLEYGASAVTGLIHNALVMVGIIGFFQFEVNTATIAAILTVIGYSLNDNIVIFDRIRENQLLLRDKEKDFTKIVDKSITQSLGRTIITSFSTLLAVVAIYIFGSGVIQIFALNLMIGIVVGTYSSIYTASPLLIMLMNFSKKRSKFAADLEKKAEDKTLEAEEPKKLSEEPKKTAAEPRQLPAESANTEEKADKENKTPPAPGTPGARWQPKRKKKK